VKDIAAKKSKSKKCCKQSRKQIIYRSNVTSSWSTTSGEVTLFNETIPLSDTGNDIVTVNAHVAAQTTLTSTSAVSLLFYNRYRLYINNNLVGEQSGESVLLSSALASSVQALTDASLLFGGCANCQSTVQVKITAQLFEVGATGDIAVSDVINTSGVFAGAKGASLLVTLN